MSFDPGRVPTGHEWIIYVVAGGLMLLNGFLPPANPPEADSGADASPTRSSDKPGVTTAAAATVSSQTNKD